MQPPSTRVIDLMLRFQEERDAGKAITPEELCADCPEMLGELKQRLKNVSDLASCLDVETRTPEPCAAGPLTPIVDTLAAEENWPPAVEPARETVEGRYVLYGEIARGGMGKIVRVRDKDFERPLAMKMLLKRGGDIEERFLREARLTGLLQHPGIPAVHALGRLRDGQPFFVMKLIQGHSLDALLGKRASAAENLLRFVGIFEQICQTVGYAHSRNVIHRDLKPGNIMVGAFGEVQVMDWGLAKFLGKGDAVAHSQATVVNLDRASGASEPTMDGSVMGTLAYMAPEQARGEVESLEPSADVFGLGAILCEILTGEAPFVGASAASVLDRARRGDVSDAMSRLEACGADAGLIDLARRCLAPLRNDRPQNGAAVAEAVAVYQVELALRLRQAEIDRAATKARADEERKRYEAEQAKTRAEIKRRRTALALAASLIALILVLALGYVVRNERDLAVANRKRAEGAEQEARANQVLADKSAEEARANQVLAKNSERRALANQRQAEEAEKRAREAERENKIRAHLGQAAALRRGNLPNRRARALDEIRAGMALGPSPTLIRDLRNEAIACLAISLDLVMDRKWDGWPIGSEHVDFDAKLSIYARADRSGRVSIRHVADDTEIARLTEARGETWLRLSANGRYLLAASRTWRKVWKIDEEPPYVVFQRELGFVPYDFHPTKPLLATLLKPNTIDVFDLTKNESLQTADVGARPKGVAWHPRANQLAISHPGGIKIYDLDKKQWGAALTMTVHPTEGIAWHPNGKVLATARDDRYVQLWNVETDEVLVLEKPVGRGVAMAFNHRGSLLATTSWEGTMRLWDPRTGKELAHLPWGSFEIPRFSPDDRFIGASARAKALHFWEIATATEYRALVRDPMAGGFFGTSASIGLDGRLLAVASGDTIGFWDLKTAAYLASMPASGCYGLVFDRDLLINDGRGVNRWPVQANAKSELRIGPPTKLNLPGTHHQIASMNHGAIVAQAIRPGARVLLQNPERVVQLSPHGDARYVAISPDGRWIATGAHNGVGARVWDTQTGALVRELPFRDPSGRVEFSADGLWLATQSPACQLWKTGTWTRGRQTSAMQFAFAPDGKTMAVETGAGVVRLLDPDNGRELVRFENPLQEPGYLLLFSSDGTSLIAIGGETYPIHLWDLRKIRQQLAAMGLDWDAPFPPATRKWTEAPLRIEILPGGMP